MAKPFILTIYYLTMLGLSLFGFQALFLTLLYLQRRGRASLPLPPKPQHWPRVTIQLPIYNEQLVVCRLIRAVCSMDYPGAALSIQVLDDSTDGTTVLARKEVKEWKKRGVDIRIIQRKHRNGFKAGALAAGLGQADGEYITIFDADFVPAPDFLRRLIPYLEADPKIGVVQARWTYLNDLYNPITRAQGLSLDGQLIVIQNARQFTGLVNKFTGSAGVWRRECIREAGGWSADSLTEDLDLSIRARLKGWDLLYVPEVVVPSEIPPQLSAYKAQLYRWAFGSMQVLRKMWRPLLWGPLRPIQSLDALIHLSLYTGHLLFLIILLVCVPAALFFGIQLPLTPWFWIAGAGGPLLVAVSQKAIYPDWKKRMLYFPVLILFGFGFGLNISLAVASGLLGRNKSFNRTPKYDLKSNQDRWAGKGYRLAPSWIIAAEFLMMLYTGAAALTAFTELPRIAPLLALISVSYGYVAFMGFWQEQLARRTLRRVGVR